MSSKSFTNCPIVPPSGCPKTRPENDRSPALVALGEGKEADVLGKDDPAELSRAVQHFFVGPSLAPVLNGRQHVHAPVPQLVRDRLRNVDVHVERDGHSQ